MVDKETKISPPWESPCPDSEKFSCPEADAPEGKAFHCFYRKDGLCTFWEQAWAIPAAWEKVFPDDPDDDSALRDIDTFREPCLTEMEKRDEACAGFHIPFEKGWLKCEECNESLCPYEGQRFYIGDELAWMRELPVSGHNVRSFMLLRRVMRRLTDRFFWWRHGIWRWWRLRRHTTGRAKLDLDF
ncbi:hypothetical protein ES708_11391 [subsurface metagenome]